MPLTSLSIDFVCQVLKQKNLIDDELLRRIKLMEEKHRQTLLRKSGSNGESIPITSIEIISSMKLHAPNEANTPLSEELITKTLAAHWQLPFLKIDLTKISPCMVVNKVSEPFARKHLTIPVSISKNIMFVAVVNPMDIEALDTIRSTSKLKIHPVVSTKSDILKVIQKCYGLKQAQKTDEQNLSSFHLSIDEAHKEMSGTRDGSGKALNLDTGKFTDKHIVNVVNLMLRYAFEQRASEIHLEPKRSYSAIRFRIDGILYDVKQIPVEVHNSMLLRLKALANMGISERRKPQDGRTHFKFHDREIHLRISSVPVAFGEKLMLRLLDPIMLFRHIEDLGFSSEELEQYLSFITQSTGIILITGPSNSGKTTTLYSTLNQLAEKGINITTIEEPIEAVHDSFNQIEVQTSAGITFGTAIRHIVRQSPDIIMVGEMRDKESVENTMQAALTGHLVISSLHTHDAPSALVRLVNVGVKSFLVESTVIAVLAQRLIRRVCESCATSYRPLPQEIKELQLTPEEIETASIRKGAGCAKCRGTGYSGQTAIVEILEMTDEIRAVLHDNMGAFAIKNAAREHGMVCLREKAIARMKAGITTPEEVLRVTGGLKTGKRKKFKSKLVFMN